MRKAFAILGLACVDVLVLLLVSLFFVETGVEEHTLWWCVILCVLYVVGRPVNLWIYHKVMDKKASKSSNANIASNFQSPIAQSRKFKDLFERMLLDEIMGNGDTKRLLYEVVSENPKGWKAYCLSRASEYKPFYCMGKEIFAYKQEENKRIRGTITNITFGIEWWYYNVSFSEPISINNSWPSDNVRLLAKTIMDIETGRAECSSYHYV